MERYGRIIEILFVRAICSVVRGFVIRVDFSNGSIDIHFVGTAQWRRIVIWISRAVERIGSHRSDGVALSRLVRIGEKRMIRNGVGVGVIGPVIGGRGSKYVDLVETTVALWLELRRSVGRDERNIGDRRLL